MIRRQQLTEVQIAALFDPLTDQRELVRHYTLSEADITIIRRRRGDHNRLGYALMLCYLRYPGRPLHAGEQPAAALVSFVADQIDVLPDTINEYLASEQNRRRHAVELQDQLGLRPFGTRAAVELTNWLLPRAIENDQLSHLAELVLEECRQRRIIIPWPQRLERLCIEARHRARREVQRRLTDGLSADQRRKLDALALRRDETNQTWLTWLRQMPEAAKPVSMLGMIERLDHVRAIGLEPARGHRVHQARLAQLSREASRTTAQHIAELERQRRHATLVAVSLDLAASLTDQALDLFDRLVGAMFRKAEGRHARAFQADGRAINEKVRLYARVGAALIAAHDDEQDAFGAITAVISWERFRATVAEAQALARPETFDAYQKVGEHYSGIRRWSPAFLAAFEFESVPTSALMRAIEVLREMNSTGASVLPKSAPTGFVRQRWAAYVLPGGEIDRRQYELCVLSELRDRLLAGEVWVTGSRRHRSFEERLVNCGLSRIGNEDVMTTTLARYQRIAPFYDLLDLPFERRRYSALRPLLFENLGGKLLDAGVGTGRNCAYYPPGAEVSGIDTSAAMLARARRRCPTVAAAGHLHQMDVAALQFPNGSFDSAVASFLFCVLPDDQQAPALRELGRVVKPGGVIRLLEYVRPTGRLRRFVSRLWQPWIAWAYGASFDRNTEKHVVTAGLELEESVYVVDDLLKMLTLRVAAAT